MRSTIGFTTKSFGGTTGAAHSALDVALSLSQAGSLLVARAWLPRALPARIDGHVVGSCQHALVPLLTHATAVLRRDASPASLAAAAAFRLTHALSATNTRARPDIEVINSVGAETLFRACRPDRDVRSVLIVRESPRHAEANVVGVSGAAAIMRSHEHVVFVSDVGRAEWTPLAGLAPERTSHIPNCVLETRTQALEQRSRAAVSGELGFAAGKLHIACVGTIHARKGQDLLVSAVEQLGARASDVVVHFVGPLIGEWGAELRARAERGPAREAFHFVGQVADPYPYVYASDLLVLASRAEAFPRVVLEAMALGTCVVGSDADGISEQIASEETGLLFPNGSSEALSAALRVLLDDTDKRTRFGLAGRARYYERFSRQQHIARYAALIDRLSEVRR